MISGFTIVRNAITLDYPIVPAIRSILDLCDEIVVNVGASGDETRELITGIGDPRIRVLTHPRNRGKGAAIRTAVAQATGDYLVILDADLEYDPDDIPRLLCGGDSVQFRRHHHRDQLRR